MTKMKIQTYDWRSRHLSKDGDKRAACVLFDPKHPFLKIIYEKPSKSHLLLKISNSNSNYHLKLVLLEKKMHMALLS